MKNEILSNSKITIKNGDFVGGNKKTIINNYGTNIEETLNQIYSEIKKLDADEDTIKKINDELKQLKKEITTNKNTDNKKIMQKITKITNLIAANAIIDVAAQKLLFLLDNLIKMFTL